MGKCWSRHTSAQTLIMTAFHSKTWMQSLLRAQRVPMATAMNYRQGRIGATAMQGLSAGWVVHRQDDDTIDVCLVDFDWSGKVGEARYPGFLNPQLPWHPGVHANKLLKQKHDTHVLHKSIEALQVGRESLPFWPSSWLPGGHARTAVLGRKGVLPFANSGLPAPCWLCWRHLHVRMLHAVSLQPWS